MKTQKKMRSALIKTLLLLLTLTQITPVYIVHAAENTPKGWIAVEAGYASSFSICSDNTLWAWGWNAQGQLGDGTTVDKYNPVKIMDDVAAVSADRNSTIAIKTDGSLWAWGSNDSGRLGDGTTIDRLLPVKIMDDVLAVSSKGYATYAIKTDGSLWAWGLNGSGKLGDGTTTHRNLPVKIMEDVVAISPGGSYTMAIKTDGSLWAWGVQISGEFGDGFGTSQQLFPIKVMDDIITVSAGQRYAFAIKTDGSLWAWGYGGDGQLGDGTTVDKHNPVKILDDVAAVSAGWDHSMAIKTDGSLWAWGSNKWGELGDDTELAQNILEPMRIRDDVLAVSVGDRYTLVILADKSMWAWGSGGYGVLGDGTTDGRRTPARVISSDMLPGGLPTVPPPTPSGWASIEVNKAIAAGLVPQELQTNYQSDVTRGEVAQIFINLIENVSGQTIDAFMVANGVTSNNAAFIDTDDYAVLAANALGIIQGVGGNRFDPDGILTRAQITVIINRVARAMGIETDGYTHTFTDIKDAWVDAELGWPVHTEIIQGIGENKFYPEGNLSVEMAIVITYRALAPLTRYLKTPLFEGKSADTSFSVLNDRFSIMMPEGAEDEAVYYGGIMGTVSDALLETKIVFSENEQTFVVHAQELFKFSTGDLSKDMAIFLSDDAESSEDMYIISGIVDVSDIQYTTITPREINASETALVKGALIKMSDDSLVYLSIIANADALTFKEDCVLMAESVISSVRGGSRHLNTERKTVDILGGFEIESGYVFENQRGIDFDVYYFYKLVTIGEDQPTFGIYTGGHPSLFGSRLLNHAKTNDVIMGQSVIWDVYTTEADVIDNDTFAETLVEFSVNDEQYVWNTYIHIFVHPRSQDDWNAILTMLRAIT